MAKDNPFISLADFERSAFSSMQKMYYDYYAGGAVDEITLKDNCDGFERIKLYQRAMVGLGKISTSCNFFGETLSLPALIAPTAMHSFATDEGELATARGASKVGTIMCVSTIASKTLEEVANVTSAPLWFQLYIRKDRGATKDLLERVYASGYKAIELTVDAPVLGIRYRDVQNRLVPPKGVNVQNLDESAKLRSTKGEYKSSLATHFAEQIDSGISWDDIEWVKKNSNLPVFVKGIVHKDDAVKAVESGANGVIVSNHGGRQLDGSIATIDALVEVKQALSKSGVPILMDGGIRRGTDILKALALGADAVQVGRLVLWALAAGGEDGVTTMFSMLKAELENAMGLCGFDSIDKLKQKGLSVIYRSV